MSSSTQQNTEAKTSRVQVGNLRQEEKELKDQEAENVKGGGGLAGGVVPTSRNIKGGLSGGVIASHIGEEIPQTKR